MLLQTCLTFEERKVRNFQEGPTIRYFKWFIDIDTVIGQQGHLCDVISFFILLLFFACFWMLVAPHDFDLAHKNLVHQ